MKTFQQFITEAQDKDDYALTPQRKPGEGGRIRASRKKTDVEKRRTKVVGGKRVPVDYKPRKDIGTNKPRSQREQQPTQDKHTQQLTPKERQRKAYLERKAKEKGAKTQTASELLAKKKKEKVDPKYKPHKASGLSHRERLNLVKKGEKKLRDIQLKNLGKTKESELKHPITQKEVTRRRKKEHGK